MSAGSQALWLQSKTTCSGPLTSTPGSSRTSLTIMRAARTAETASSLHRRTRLLMTRDTLGFNSGVCSNGSFLDVPGWIEEYPPALCFAHPIEQRRTDAPMPRATFWTNELADPSHRTHLSTSHYRERLPPKWYKLVPARVQANSKAIPRQGCSRMLVR
jgi:hypothetical protein